MPSLMEYAQEWSIRDLKKEYTRLRNKFQKQIGRLAQVDPSARVKSFLPGGYKFQRTIKEIENLRGRQHWSEKAKREDWARRLTELRGLTEARSLSLSGRRQIRKDAIQQLRDDGFDNINEGNFDKFTSFMNFAKAQGVLNQYDSNEVAEAFDQWISGGLLEDNELGDYIAEWQDTAEAIDLFN